MMSVQGNIRRPVQLNRTSTSGYILVCLLKFNELEFWALWRVIPPDLDWIPNIHEYALIFRDKNYLFTLSSQRASEQESGAYYKSLRGVFMACF
jgi:hypothetical protein